MAFVVVLVNGAVDMSERAVVESIVEWLAGPLDVVER